MSEPGPPIQREDEGADDEGVELQFDQAELATPAAAGPSLAACKRPILDAYYEINGKIVCNACRQHIDAFAVAGARVWARLLKASLFGFVAALLGAALYFIIARVSGLEIGIVALLPGFMVGGAVRRGTNNRGGLLYQFLASLLTYFAIGMVTLTFLVEHFVMRSQQNPNQCRLSLGKRGKPSPRPKFSPNHLPGAAVDQVKGKDAVVPKAGAEVNGPAKAPNVAANKDSPIAGDPKRAADAEAQMPDGLVLPESWLLRALGAAFFIVAGPVLIAFQAPISGLIVLLCPVPGVANEQGSSPRL